MYIPYIFGSMVCLFGFGLNPSPYVSELGGSIFLGAHSVREARSRQTRSKMAAPQEEAAVAPGFKELKAEFEHLTKKKHDWELRVRVQPKLKSPLE